MKRLVLMMTLLAWGMSEDVVPPKEVEAGKKPPKYWEKDMHPTPAMYDGDWKDGVPKEFIGKPQLSVPKQIHVELTTEKEDVKNWKVIDSDPGYETKDGFYRLMGRKSNDGMGSGDFWQVYTIKDGNLLGWYLEYWKETGLLRGKWFSVKFYAVGWAYRYHPNGQLAEKSWNNKGTQGWTYMYHPNGQLAEKSWSIHGNKRGWVYKYYPNGVLKEKGYYSDEGNIKNFRFYPTGELEEEDSGTIDINPIVYYKNGNIKVQPHFNTKFNEKPYWDYFKEDGTFLKREYFKGEYEEEEY